MSENEDLFEAEQQRAYMQSILRNCAGGVLISVDRDGELTISYMNLTQIERRGIIELLHDTVPKFLMMVDTDDDDS